MNLYVNRFKHAIFFYRPRRLFALVDATLLLIRRLLAILKSAEHHVKVLQASTSLTLFSISRLNSLCLDKEKAHKDEKIKAAFGELKEIFWKWITNSNVIGGSVFGANVRSRYWKGELELEVGNIHSNRVEW